MDNIFEQINKAVIITRMTQQKCLVEGFRLVKVILPKAIADTIKLKTIKTIHPLAQTEDPVTFMGIPCEVDENIFSIQYVIEGRLNIL